MQENRRLSINAWVIGNVGARMIGYGADQPGRLIASGGTPVVNRWNMLPGVPLWPKLEH
jgi:hypothetical protein